MRPADVFEKMRQNGGADFPVLIRTDRQLVPNASYEFEVRIEDGKVLLVPTTRDTTRG